MRQVFTSITLILLTAQAAFAAPCDELKRLTDKYYTLVEKSNNTPRGTRASCNLRAEWIKAQEKIVQYSPYFEQCGDGRPYSTEIIGTSKSLDLEKRKYKDFCTGPENRNLR